MLNALFSEPCGCFVMNVWRIGAGVVPYEFAFMVGKSANDKGVRSSWFVVRSETAYFSNDFISVYFFRGYCNKLCEEKELSEALIERMFFF